MWQSQISSDNNQQYLPTNNRSIRLSHHTDQIIISIPNFYHVTPNLRIFTSAKDAILFRFITNEYAVINPSNTLMDELTLFNEDDSIPEHVLNLSTCTTLQNTSTYSDTQFPASQDLFSSAEEGLDGSCDLFSDFSATGNSECDKKRKFEISDESDSHSVSLLSGKRPRNFRNK
ncbi:unnamed protein product [Mytilus edulis]|uniref:Uncharacterized protein n=1 Tax=Mytilus edulis TaxID=6550 RepID=A0A8S3SXZ6_MYTED|nr:unnamed protein product [Mytilus edulis]